jgi:hypothetical protein
MTDMGYDIHITRAKHWEDSQQQSITAAEWLEFVAADPELEIDPRDNGPYFALWKTHEVEGDHPWFDWFRGAISTKNPDGKTFDKAFQIARHFRAQVQGDDGEVYEARGPSLFWYWPVP